MWPLSTTTEAKFLLQKIGHLSVCAEESIKLWPIYPPDVNKVYNSFLAGFNGCFAAVVCLGNKKQCHMNGNIVVQNPNWLSLVILVGSSDICSTSRTQRLIKISAPRMLIDNNNTLKIASWQKLIEILQFRATSDFVEDIITISIQCSMHIA